MTDAATPAPPESSPVRREVPTWRKAVTTLSVFTLLGLSGAGSCDAEKKAGQSFKGLLKGSKTLQEVRDRPEQKLRIAVLGDVPFVSYLNPETGRYEGFEIEIAKELAKELGYDENEIKWISIGHLSDRGGILGNDTADIVVASFSMTKGRRDNVEFAGPYLSVPQAVLVHRKATGQLRTIEDLRRSDVRVCTITGSTSEVALERKHIRSLPVNRNTDCMAGMESKKYGNYDAFSTDWHILAGFEAGSEEESNQNRFTLLDLAIADNYEELGIAVAKDDTQLRDALAYLLNKWQTGPEKTSPWIRAYNSTLGRLNQRRLLSQPDVENPPEIIDHDSKEPQE